MCQADDVTGLLFKLSGQVHLEKAHPELVWLNKVTHFHFLHLDCSYNNRTQAHATRTSAANANVRRGGQIKFHSWGICARKGACWASTGKCHATHPVTACLGKLLPSHNSKRKSPYSYSSHSLVPTKANEMKKAIAKHVRPDLTINGQLASLKTKTSSMIGYEQFKENNHM